MTIGANELTPQELRLHAEAQGKFRDALPSRAYFHTEPIRNPSGTLAAFRAFDRQDEPRRLLAEIDILVGGDLQKVRTYV